MNKKIDNNDTSPLLDLLAKIIAKAFSYFIDSVLLNAALIHFKILPQDNINVFYIFCILYALK